MSFLVSGSIAYDQLLNHEGSFASGIDPKQLEHLSVSFIAQRFVRHHGGTGANIAWNLALLGAKPMLTGAVGHDGDEYLQMLEEKGVNVKYVDRISGHVTATAIIATDDDAHQIAFFHPGADAHGSVAEFVALKEHIGLAIVSPRDAVQMIKTARGLATAKIPYLFDPGQQSHAFSRDEFRSAVSHSVGLIVNDYEWSLAAKKLEWDERATIDACSLLVITRGENGVTLKNRIHETQVPACKTTELVNPTGAGDAFRAGLMVGMSKNWSLEDCGRLGATLATFVIEQEGTLLNELDIREVERRAKENYGVPLPSL